jgi:hypothetical protein
MWNAATRIHGRCVAGRCDVVGAGAAASDTAADSDFPSRNPDYPAYGNRWGSVWPAFFRELRRLGYVEGQNLVIERYSAEGHHERYSSLAREIVARNPDLIVRPTRS